jgi:hypothetical protein
MSLTLIGMTKRGNAIACFHDVRCQEQIEHQRHVQSSSDRYRIGARLQQQSSLPARSHTTLIAIG